MSLSPGNVALTLDTRGSGFATSSYAFRDATVHWTKDNTVKIIGIMLVGGREDRTPKTYTYPRERVVSVVES